MLQSLFIINSTGEVVIEKHWRGLVSRSAVDSFWSHVQKCSSLNEVPPVIPTSKYYLISVLRNRMFYMAVVPDETPPLMIIEFLSQVFTIFSEYFKEVSEDALRENFVTVYQLLDEMMDNGYPFNTEPTILREMIYPPNLLNTITSTLTGTSNVATNLPEGSLSSIPWRKQGIKYTNNEIYVDLVENVDIIIDASSQLVSSEIIGEIMCNCRLSGMPDLTLSFVDASILDDCSFHPCVRYNRFERDRILSFVPPNGQFRLMKYKSNRSVELPIYVRPQFSWFDNQGKVQVLAGIKPNTTFSDKAVEEVVITIPFPKVVESVRFTVTFGEVQFDEVNKVCRWRIGTMPKQQSPQLTGHIQLTSSAVTPESNPTLSLDFKIMQATMSTLKVNKLNLTNETYKPYKGVRSLIKSGNIQIRA